MHRYCCCGGYVYVCGEDNGSGETVWKLNPDLTEVWNYDTIGTANRLAVDTSGNVYIAHNNDGVGSPGNSLTKLDSSGNRVWRTYNSLLGVPLGASAYDVGVSDDGSYISHTDTTGGVWQFNSSGVQQWAAGTTINNSSGCAVDNDGNTFVTEYNVVGSGARNVIEKFNNAGTSVATGSGPLATHEADSSDILIRGDVVYTGGSYSIPAGPGAGVHNLQYNRSDLSNHGSQAADATSTNDFMRIAWAGGLMYNLDNNVKGPATFDVSGTSSTPVSGMGGTGGSYYASAKTRNDGHDGATASVFRDVFKFSSGGTLEAAVDVGAGNIIHHLIVSPYG